jgi:hypothetical protein
MLLDAVGADILAAAAAAHTGELLAVNAGHHENLSIGEREFSILARVLGPQINASFPLPSKRETSH